MDKEILDKIEKITKEAERIAKYLPKELRTKGFELILYDLLTRDRLKVIETDRINRYKMTGKIKND